jgi:hypothetical protein
LKKPKKKKPKKNKDGVSGEREPSGEVGGTGNHSEIVVNNPGSLKS